MEEVWNVWVDWRGRILSFHAAQNFEKLEYPTHKEMLEFALEKSREGFAIQ